MPSCSPVASNDRAFLCPKIKRRYDMKFLAIVLIIRIIIALLHKEKNEAANDDVCRNEVRHPAEFRLRY